jgi:hypothetical protein
MFELHTTEVSHVLQSVIAPAFLLAGIGTFMNVMTQRLVKILERVRELATDDFDSDPTPHPAMQNLPAERLHDSLVQRARLINRAITLCTAAAVMICMLIALLFADALLHTDLSVVVVVMFVIALLTLILGLLNFLLEIYLTTKALRGANLLMGKRPLRKAT